MSDLPDGSRVEAISVAGQQHGMVALDADDRPVHPAKLWNDTESAPDAGWLIEQLGSAEAWADAVGSVPVAAFTATKLSWLHRSHPAAWERMARVVLPHDYLTHRLTGAYTTDRGDASGTGYWSPSTGGYRWDVLAIIDAERDWSTVVPTVLGPLDVAGQWNDVAVAVGTGDNMAAALGLGLAPGDAALSVGTSGTAFTVAGSPTADPSGAVAGFADATGRFLPLVCTSNAAKVLDAVARLLGVDHAEFDRLALAAVGDPQVPVLLPYFDGETNTEPPERDRADRRHPQRCTHEQFALAAVQGVACGLLDALDALRAHAAVTGRVVLTGGGRSRPRSVRSWPGYSSSHSCSQVSIRRSPPAQPCRLRRWPAGTTMPTVQARWGLGVGSDAIEPVDSGGLRERYAELRELGR